MKKMLCCCLLMAAFCCYGQPSIPEYGKIDKSDLALTECSFDSGAVAFKLFNYGKVRFGKGEEFGERSLANMAAAIGDGVEVQFNIVTEVRTRIKILKKAGIPYADVKIPFFKTERISKVKACTYNLDDKGNVLISHIDKGDIYTEKTSNQFSKLIIVFNNVKVGSVIEYSYVLETQNDYYIRDWYFQSEIPERLSYYNVTLPLSYGFGEDVFVNHPSAFNKFKETTEFYSEGKVNVSVPSGNRIIYLQNVPSIKKESYMGAARDYLQRVYYHPIARLDDKVSPDAILKLWRKQANWFNEEVGVANAIFSDIRNSKELLDEAREKDDILERVKIIYNYVSSNINCTDREVIYPNIDVKKVWEKRTGNMADVNLLLVNLLKKAGIDALPFLGSTYKNGGVAEDYPSFRQFNVLMAYVPVPNGFYLLDATSPIAMPDLIPREMLATRGFLLNADASEFIDVTDNGQDYKQIINVQINLSDSTARGTAIVKSYGYAKSDRINAWLLEKDKFAAEYFTNPQYTFPIDSLVIKNEFDDTQPLDQSFSFVMPLHRSGNYQYIMTNLFTGLYRNPFTDKERLTNVEFRYMQSYYLNVTIILPDGYAYEELPKSINLVMPDKSIECKREVTAKGNMVKLKMALVYHKADFPADEYSFLKEYYKKLYNLLEEQIVVVKK